MFILNILVATVCLAEGIKVITIRDENFKIVKKLESTDEIRTFSEHWSEKIKQISTKRNWKFKIDIEPGDRWLYDTEGYFHVLTVKSSTPDYKIKSIEAFNKLIGVSNN